MSRAEEIWLFIHLLGVFALVSGVAIEIVLVTAALRATTVEKVAAYLAPLKVLPAVFGVAALVLLAAGSSLVHKEHKDGDPLVHWGAAWVDIAIVVLLGLTAIAPFVWGKPLAAVHEQAEAAGTGPVPAAIAAALRKPSIHIGMRAAWCEVIAALFVMSNKPGWGGSVAAVVIAAVVGAGLAQLGTKQVAA
ncbi:MAG TPA: hypothetical protein VHE83_11155 [Mycobacteriales bacterium]|nr:hypothetical protein [Mycobacteriales bacterium]